ncbi:hypothetical protein EDD27_5691 [Nonomuraea polychroma]|uniref:Uncharacterized protein n=1 Tax=Nonomuraea polychroma TaxID=46176 RepID=A0A438MBC2_9ACTN|nr:hypothetical protein [Nonomuraea polychroma]RVX43024.1 hypothetical protein EDD27_5691 [Nonomuraea polychroma]
MSAKPVARTVALQRRESERLQRHVGAALAAMRNGMDHGWRHLSAEDAEQLWRAGVGIMAIVGEARERPADVIDLDAERRRRRR